MTDPRKLDGRRCLARLCRRFAGRLAKQGLLPELRDPARFVDEALKSDQFKHHGLVASYDRALELDDWDKEGFAVDRDRHDADTGRDVQIVMAALADAVFRYVLAARWNWYQAEHKQLTRYTAAKLRDAVLEGRSADQFVDSAIDRTRDGFRRWRPRHRTCLQDHLRDCVDSEIWNHRKRVKKANPGGAVSFDDLPEGSEPSDARADYELRSYEFSTGMKAYLRLLEATDKRLSQFVECWLAAYQEGQDANANQFVANRLNISILEVRNLARRVRDHARKRVRKTWEG